MPTLHPQIVKALEAMEKLGLAPIEAMTPAEARAQMEATAQSRKAEALPVDRVEERAIPGPAGDIRLRPYRPRRGRARSSVSRSGRPRVPRATSACGFIGRTGPNRFRRSSITMAAAMSSAV